VIATAYAALLFLTAKPALATSATFPSSEFFGGAFRLQTIIIAYFHICNNNFHFAK
jgi:hypothetical protein